MMIFVHVLLGIFAFVSSIMLGVSFSQVKENLTVFQKIALMLNVSAIGLSAILGISLTGNKILTIISFISLVLFEYVFLFKKDSSKSKEN